MIKPDNFPFSQEVLDDIQTCKAKVLADKTYLSTKEGAADVKRLAPYILSHEYDQYLTEEFKKEGITYRAEYTPD